jgi:hypothetical protein
MSVPVYTYPPAKIYREGKYEGHLFTVTYKVRDFVDWLLKNYNQESDMQDPKGFFHIVSSPQDGRLYLVADTKFLNFVDGAENPRRPRKIVDLNPNKNAKWAKELKRIEGLGL